MDYSLQKVMKITACVKVGTLLLIFLGYHFLPFNFDNEKGNSLGPVTPFNFENTLKTWDTQHYLYLAEHGYAPGQMSNAFYPLLPYLIRIFSFLFAGNALLAGLFLSHLFTFAAMVYLYRLARQLEDEKTAYFSCLFLLAFPASFYLGLVYTESLFLMLASALFYYMGERKTGPAVACAILLPLTRPTGLLILVPVVIGLWTKEYLKNKNSNFSKWVLPIGFLVGYGIYLALMKCLTGDYFAAANSEKYFLTNYSTERLFHPLDWFLHNFIQIDFSVTGVHSGILNRLWFVFYLIILVSLRKTLNRTLFYYSLVLGLVPALSGDFASYARYLVVVFPLFISLAHKWRNDTEYYFLACLPLQGLFCVAHCLYDWVA